MSASIRTELSKSGLALTRDAAATRVANACLAAARHVVVPLNLQGVSLVLQQVHFGPSRYPRDAAAATHRHEEVQIEFITAGRVSFEGPGGGCLLTDGQGCLIAPGTLHAWRAEESTAMLGVQFQVVGRERPAFEQHLHTCLQGNPARFDTDAVNVAALAMLREIRDGLWRRERLADRIHLWLTEILMSAVDLKPWQPAERVHRSETRGEELCNLAMAFMRANLSQPLQVADVALQVGVSERHLNRLFREHVNSSVAAELMTLRLDRARKRLETDPAIPVKTVAYECGFNHHAYFTSCFKKAFGCTPRDVRR